MTKSSYYVSHDATGKQYIYQCGGELNKNHNIGDTPNDTTGEGCIYETNYEDCLSVHLLSSYRTSIPYRLHRGNNPEKNIKSEDTIWYTSALLGEKSLGGMMPKLSLKYKLSQRYTNHSICITSVQTLEDVNVEGRHIV